jgi:hypothetical protein
VKKVVTAHGRVRGEQRRLWMVTGYLLSLGDFRVFLENYSRSREGALWSVKEFVEEVTNRKGTGKLALTSVCMPRLARTI